MRGGLKARVCEGGVTGGRAAPVQRYRKRTPTRGYPIRLQPAALGRGLTVFGRASILSLAGKASVYTYDHYNSVYQDPFGRKGGRGRAKRSLKRRRWRKPCFPGMARDIIAQKIDGAYVYYKQQSAGKRSQKPWKSVGVPGLAISGDQCRNRTCNRWFKKWR